MLYHCRMWCYAIGVEAVVLRSWCVILCTLCQLVSNWPNWILTDKECSASFPQQIIITDTVLSFKVSCHISGCYIGDC